MQGALGMAHQHRHPRSRPSCGPCARLLYQGLNSLQGASAGKPPSPTLGSLGILPIPETWSPRWSRLMPGSSRSEAQALPGHLKAYRERRSSLWFAQRTEASRRNGGGSHPGAARGTARLWRKTCGPRGPRGCRQKQGQSSAGVSSGALGHRSHCRCSETAPRGSQGDAAPGR